MQSLRVLTREDPRLIEPLNVLIDALKRYIAANKVKVERRDHYRRRDVLSTATAIYNAAGQSRLLGDADSLLANGLPRIGKLHFVTFMQHLARRREMHTKIDKVLKEMQTGLTTRSEFKTEIEPAFRFEISRFNEVVYFLANNVEYYTSLGVTNSILAQTPRDVWKLILENTDDYTRLNTRQACSFFNDLLKDDPFYRRLITKNFKLSEEEINKFKTDKESYKNIYFKVQQINILCVSIREQERTQMPTNEAVRYKQTEDSHRRDILTGLANGIPWLQQHLNQLYEIRNQAQREHILTGYGFNSFGA